MKLTIEFRHCTIENGFITTAVSISRFSNAPKPVVGGIYEVKNVEECNAAILTAVDCATIKPGTYVPWIKTEGRKVRKYDEWERTIKYISIDENKKVKVHYR